MELLGQDVKPPLVATNVPYSHRNKVLCGSVPDILPVYNVLH
jgi:hypothetical protein